MSETHEGSIFPLSPETTKSGGNAKLNSAGKTSSGASLTLSNNKQKFLPHYLRASTGSCHDFCKYGRKHAFESMDMHPPVRRFSCSAIGTEKGESKVKGLTAKIHKKTPRQGASVNQSNELSDRPDTLLRKALSPAHITVCEYTEDHLGQNSFFPEKSNLSQSSETVVCDFTLPSEKIVPLDKFETIKPDTPGRNVFHDDPETIGQKYTPPKITEMLKYPETKNKKLYARKKYFSQGPVSIQQRTPASKRISASIKANDGQKAQSSVKARFSASFPRDSKKETSFNGRLGEPVGSAMSGKSRIRTLKVISPKDFTALTTMRKNENKGENSVKPLISREKKTPKLPSTASFQSPIVEDSRFRRYGGPSGHPRGVEKSQLDFVEIKEKTLYIIEQTHTEDRTFQQTETKASSCQLFRSSSSSSFSSTVLSFPSISDCKQDANLEVESELDELCPISEHVGTKPDKVIQQTSRSTATHGGDEETTPYKLKFRRGKVVDPQSDDNGARRVRFKEGMRLGDAESGKREIEKRSFSRKESAVTLNHSEPEAKPVVLRHQDVQDKKDAHDLLNQIIEETASKLVKTRKSKVKALVGAFESVISLRDSIKPAA